MDSEGLVCDTEKCQGSFQKSSKHINETGDVLEADKAIVEPSLGPITPESSKENGDFPLDLGSPLTVGKGVPKVFIFTSKTSRHEGAFASVDNSTSPCTPKDGVFDPFAPGPDDMVLAPLCKKYLNQARPSVARRLDFSSSFKGKIFYDDDDVESFTDEEMFESVYENLLEAIVLNQTEGALAEISSLEWDSDACKTPPLAPRLSGVAETCPGAPLRPSSKSRVIDLGLCRKLEF